MSAAQVLVLADAECVAVAAADEVVGTARSASFARPVAIAFSGGRTPIRMFEILAASETCWDHVHVFWADERCVPPSDPRSNFHGANAAGLFLRHVPLANIHRIRGELGSSAAAVAYEAELRGWFASRGDVAPHFDLVLLGMGADGHTASLFPRDAALDAAGAWAVAATAPVEPRDRVTLSLESIAAARRVVCVVTGAEKRSALAAIRRGGSDLPAARIAASLWIVDLEASGAAPRL